MSIVATRIVASLACRFMVFHNRVGRALWWAVWFGVVAVLGAVLMFRPLDAYAEHDDGPYLHVTASFSILADIVEAVGGDRVEVTSLVGRNLDVASFEPTPHTLRVLASSDVLVGNGLGLEAWLPRVMQASGFSGTHIVASYGIKRRRINTGAPGPAKADLPSDVAPSASTVQRQAGVSNNQYFFDAYHHDDSVDPRAWHDLNNGMIYAENIAAGLILADPEHASYYKRRLKKYLERLQKLDDELRLALNAIPASHRIAITANDVFGYFGEAYSIQFIALSGLADKVQPSSPDIAPVVDLVRAYGHVGVFTDSSTDGKQANQLVKATDAPAGGPLYSDALGDADEPAGTYMGMFHWNAGQLISVLKPDTSQSWTAGVQPDSVVPR